MTHGALAAGARLTKSGRRLVRGTGSSRFPEIKSFFDFLGGNEMTPRPLPPGAGLMKSGSGLLRATRSSRQRKKTSYEFNMEEQLASAEDYTKLRKEAGIRIL